MSARWVEALTAAEQAAVHALAAAARAADGVPPLSDQTQVELARPGGHLLAEHGYAHLDAPGDEPGDDSALVAVELVVHPDHRRQGVGTALVHEIRSRADHLEVWAHGDLPAARAFAGSLGLVRRRVLWQLHRPAADPLPEVRWPDGVHVRTFVPGRDEESWLAVNAAAFAHHPEQGRWTRADLEAREAEPWFDAAGFFLAVRDEEVVGFHWTKRHDAATGEVYVVGVAPGLEGQGLGRSLTVRGLEHLRDAGCTTVILYVDDDNPRAVGLYERLGFTRAAVDATYA